MEDIDFDLAQLETPAVVAPAAPPEPPRYELVPERKSNAIRNREIAFQVLSAIDAVQTISWCGRFDKSVKCEMNPIFGRHPSTGKIIGIKLADGLLHYLVTERLKRRNPEWVELWQVSTIIIQSGVVAWNCKVMF